MANLAAALVPTSPTQLVFGEKTMSPTSSGGKEDGGGAADKENGGDGGGTAEESTGPIQPKQFFWDQFLVYVSTIIALLTVLDVTLQFFRGGGLACRVPVTIDEGQDNASCGGAAARNLTLEAACSSEISISRDEVAYINTFCQESLSRAEYYPFFVLIQGLLLAAPQYLWAALFVGQFDFFFGLVQQLDRLRSRDTGEYRAKNFEIVSKLEKQFPRKWKWIGIFFFYVLKLSAQLAVVVIAIIVNVTFFHEEYFNFAFDCPETLDPPPKGWWLPIRVSCVFSSFRLHKQLRAINIFLLCLGFFVILYGLWWCFKRHVNALGFKDAALFAFSSCLRPTEYVEERFFHSRKSPFNPRVRNDLDFLLLRLFRADSGHGLVFKDIQVEGELKKRIERDHELLHLYVEASKDRGRRDLREIFIQAEFDSDPEYVAFNSLGEEALGNITWESIHTPTIRNIIFGFLQFVDKNDFAMDISFGSTGYSLILARAFKDVLSLNFDPFYSNEKDVFHLQQFHADYCTVRFQENILTKGTEKLNKLEEGLSEEFDGPCPELEGSKKWLNLVLVGPLPDDGKIATVNLFLERQKNACRYAKYCILMYIRPTKIGPRNVDERFCSFTPPSDYFKKSGDGPKLTQLRFEEKIEAKKNSAPTSPGGVFIVGCEEKKNEHHILVNALCHNTQCQFEITLFEYCGPLAERRGPNLPPDAMPYDNMSVQQPSPTAGSIALIIPSQMLQKLEQEKIQQFMDGHMAIQLHARIPENPIQFILPTSPDAQTGGDVVHDNDVGAARQSPTLSHVTI